MIDTDTLTLAELRQLVESNGSVAKYADAFRMLEQLEQKSAELDKANEELRKNIEKSRENQYSQDAIKALQKDVAQIKAHTVEPQITKEQIMAVKDTSKRLKLIQENMHLFTQKQPEKTAVEQSQELQNELIMAQYGVTADMTPAEICKLMPSGYARQYAIKKALERATE